MTYLSDLPLPDVTVREGDTDPMDFTLTQADGTTPIDLSSGRIVELRLRRLRGDQTAQVYRSDNGTGIGITTPAAGKVRFSPTAATWLAAAERYRGYFAIYETATPTTNPKTVPQPRDLHIAVLAALA